MRRLRICQRRFSAADRERLTLAYKDAIENKIVPAYARMRNFIADEYLAAARESVGLLDLPDGAAWYAHNVRKITTTELTPEEIHQIGLDEVKRIHAEMRGVMQQVGFDGELSEFFTYVNADPQFFYSEPEQLIQAYRDMSADIESLAPKLFEVFPKTPFEVRRVEPFREQSASQRLLPGRTGRRQPAWHFLRQCLQRRHAAEVGYAVAVPARGDSWPSFPDLAAAGERRAAAVPPLSADSPPTPRAGACTPNRWARSSACTRTRSTTSVR